MPVEEDDLTYRKNILGGQSRLLGGRAEDRLFRSHLTRSASLGRMGRTKSGSPTTRQDVVESSIQDQD